MKTTLSGSWGEEKAAEYLKKHGYKITGMNYRCRMGEIDVIAENRKYIVFCEVKLRATLDGAAFSVTERQRRRICAAAEIFLAEHPAFSALDMRLDAILIARDGRALHLEGAFEAEG